MANYQEAKVELTNTQPKKNQNLHQKIKQEQY